MHLYLVNHYATTPDSPSGSRHFDLARALVHRGHDVTIFAAGYNHFTHRMHPGFARLETRRVAIETHQGVRYVWIRVSPYLGNGVGRLINMGQFARQVATLDLRALRLPPPSVVIGSSVHPFAVWAAEQLAMRAGVPWCFEIRDLWPQSLVDLGLAGSRHPFVWLLRRLERHLLAHAAQIFPVWPGMVAYLLEQGVSTDRITVMPHAVNFDQYPVDFIPRPTHAEPLTLCYFGSHRDNNALPPVIHAIRAAQLARPGRLRAVFIGEGDAKPALQRLADEIGAEIEFRPGVPKRALADTLVQMDGFVISVHASPLYRKYGLSFNKLYDAAAIGRPMIIATDTPLNLVAYAEAGWVVPPYDVPALTQAIMTWLDASPAERTRLGRNAWTYVRSHHNVTHLADHLLTVVDRLRPPRPSQP